MKGLFDKEELHTTVTSLSKASEEAGLKLAEVSLRWLFYHSALSTEDGVILGASTLSQIQTSLEYISHGPLPGNLPMIFEDVWEGLKDSRGSIM